MSGRPLVSIVVPAHNEGAVIAGNLRRLLADARRGEFDVVVVANACSDATAQAARDAGVRVLETPVPGKPHAIRLGDATCAAFPRIYLDADVALDTESVRALVAACAQPGVLACARCRTSSSTESAGSPGGYTWCTSIWSHPIGRWPAWAHTCSPRPVTRGFFRCRT